MKKSSTARRTALDRRQRPGSRRLGKRGARVEVGEIIDAARLALGRKTDPVVDFLRDVASFCAPRGGGDSDPTYNRILEYANAADSRARCGADFAAVIADYLYQSSADIRDIKSAELAHALCNEVLVAQRERRYEPVGTDSVSADRLHIFAGVYAACRLETSDNIPRQELLILGRHDEGSRTLTHATYLMSETVFRGRWYVVGQTIWCALTGRRRHYDYDLLSVYLAKNIDNPNLMGGFLAGTSTNGRFPTVVPVLAIRVNDASAETSRLGDNLDGPLRDALSKIQSNVVTQHKEEAFRIETLPQETLVTARLDPTSLTNAIQAKLRDDGTSLIAPSVLQFCKAKDHKTG